MSNHKKIIVFPPLGADYYYHCWGGEEMDKRIFFIYNRYPINNKYLHFLCWKIHNFCKSKKFWKFLSPLFDKCIWPNLYFYNLHLKGEKTICIFYEWNELSRDLNFIHKLRQKGVKVVLMITNYSKGNSPFNVFNLRSDYLNNFNKVFAFDPADVSDFNIEYFSLIYEKRNSQYYRSLSTRYDMFFVGLAKDRLDKIHEIYHNATIQGLKCCFYIGNVKDEDKIKGEGLFYNEELSYSKIIEFIKSSKIILDIPIQGQSGYSLRIPEAIVWGKKLITTNDEIKKEKFYHSNNILVYKNDSDLKNFLSSEFIPYSDQDLYDFSIEKLLSML